MGQAQAPLVLWGPERPGQAHGGRAPEGLPGATGTQGILKGTCAARVEVPTWKPTVSGLLRPSGERGAAMASLFPRCWQGWRRPRPAASALQAPLVAGLARAPRTGEAGSPGKWAPRGSARRLLTSWDGRS